jgi:hypothetical protein
VIEGVQMVGAEQGNASAGASKEAQTAGAEQGNDSAGAPREGQESFSQRRADALAILAEHFLATATVDDENGSTQALAGHERCQVVLHLSVDSLKAEHEHGNNCNCDHHTAPNMDHQWISMDNAKRFSSDASLYTVLEDKYGNVLNVGRKTRTINTVLARALHIRDETCRFPGCCANRYVDFHHIQHWCDGGETHPDNLIKLCRFDHRQLHQGHYSITPLPNDKQKWLFKTAAGEVIEPNPTREPCKPKAFFQTLWPNIDSQTGASRSTGEPLHYSKVLKDLLYLL